MLNIQTDLEHIKQMRLSSTDPQEKQLLSQYENYLIILKELIYAQKITANDLREALAKRASYN